MKKIDKEKSVVYRNYSDPVSLCERGYFLDNFDYPDNYFEGTLCGIRANSERPFLNTYGNWYKYFVPESTKVLVKEPKKLRPYKNVSEFLDIVGIKIGDVITIKRISCKNEYEETILFFGFRITNTENQKFSIVLLGQFSYTFEELMNNYLYYKDAKWYPFGVME